MKGSAWSAAEIGGSIDQDAWSLSLKDAGSETLPKIAGRAPVLPSRGNCEAMPEINWPVPSGQDAELRARASVLEVWAAPLDVSPAQLAQCRAVLSDSELERAARFHFEKHRRRFTAARALLRIAVSRWLNVGAAEVEFAYGPNGKPSLGGRCADSGVHFNLAHCEELAVVAITRLGSVGIDVERIRPLADADELVARFFSPGENREFQQLPQSEKAHAFFNLWTRKEAWLKATGEGIGHLLNQVEVSFLPGEAAKLLRVPGGWEGDHAWSLHELRPAEEFTAALAIASAVPELHCWRWPEYEPGRFK